MSKFDVMTKLGICATPTAKMECPDCQFAF